MAQGSGVRADSRLVKALLSAIVRDYGILLLSVLGVGTIGGIVGLFEAAVK